MIPQNARTWLTGRRLPLLVMGLALALALAASLGGWLATGGTAHASPSGGGVIYAERNENNKEISLRWEIYSTDDVTCGWVVEWNGPNDDGKWSKYSYSMKGRYTITDLNPNDQYTVRVYAMAAHRGGSDTLYFTETVPKRSGQQGGDKGKVAPPDGDEAQEGEPGRAEPPEADPLTASVVKKPSDHNGKKKFVVRVKFSEPVDAGSANIIAATSVEGGKAVKARKYKGKASVWNIIVKPTSDDDVTIRLSSSQDCTDANAVCTEDDRALSGAVSVTVSGPSDD